MKTISSHKQKTISSHKRINPIAKSEILKKIEKYGLSELSSLRSIVSELPPVVSAEKFNELLFKSIEFQRIISGRIKIPNWNLFTAELVSIFESVKEDNGGKLDDHIPMLAKVDVEMMGLSVTTVHGQTFHYGDYDVPLSVQSGSKPITYCIASSLLGPEKLHKYVGKTPSGKGFNERVLLKHLPHNPMINSGSLMCVKLIRDYGLSDADHWDYVVDIWTSVAGGNKIGFMNSVYLSEKNTADRNYCLAYMMREEGAFEPSTDLISTLNFYFMNCSLEVTVKLMSIVTATLANSGTNPLTKKQIFDSETCRNCLSLMLSCGMSYSNEFAFKLGLPGKSAASGIIIVPVIGIMGICFWSPRLDNYHLSYRGKKFFEKLGSKFAFHFAENWIKSEKMNPISQDHLSSVNLEKVGLLYASAEGNLDLAAFSIGQGISVNSVDHDGRTPLHVAAAEGHYELVRYLLSCGADPTLKDRFGYTPLEVAQKERKEDIMTYFKSPGFELDLTKCQNNFSHDYLFIDKDFDGSVTKEEFVEKMSNFGFEFSRDPRLLSLISKMPKVMDNKLFTKLISHSGVVKKTTRGRVVIPMWKNFTQKLNELYIRSLRNEAGELYSRIPYIERFFIEENLTESFSICMRTIDGQQYKKGPSSNVPLSGISSLMNYCIAVEINGSEKFEELHKHIGYEANQSADDTSTLIITSDGIYKSHNPFTIAGGIYISSLLFPHLEDSKRFDEMQRWYKKTGLTEPILNKKCYLSHYSNSDKELSVAYLLGEKGLINDNIHSHVDFYITSSSLEWSLDDISIFGATLANQGINPLTNERVFSVETVQAVITMMYFTGMETNSGEYSFTVGLPSRSSVSGLVLTVIPNILSCVCFSPKLDDHGNSSRSLSFMEELTKTFNFHIFEGTGSYQKLDPTRRVEQEKVDIASLLNFAAAGANPEILSYLEGHHMDINVRDYNQRSMAHIAASEGQIDTLELLKLKGANFEAKDRWGNTALDELESYKILNN